MKLEELILQGTDENLLGEEDLNLSFQIVDKINSNAERAKDAMAVFIKRLSQKSQNVILVTLKIIDTCVKNCGRPFHLETASKSLLNTLVKLYTDKTIHEKIRVKIQDLLGEWEMEFGSDPSLLIVKNTRDDLRNQGFTIASTAPQKPSSNTNFHEEEELQLALALSLTELENKRKVFEKDIPSSSKPSEPVVGERFVRALYDFTAAEEDELAFKKGDLITVLNSNHKDWWKGTVNGKIGLFPTNYTDAYIDINSPLDNNLLNPPPFIAINEFINLIHRQKMSPEGLKISNDANDPFQKAYREALMESPLLTKWLQDLYNKKMELTNLSQMLKSSIETYNRLIPLSNSTVAASIPPPAIPVSPVSHQARFGMAQGNIPPPTSNPSNSYY